MTQLVELQEENARLRKDAERYRWLRESKNADVNLFVEKLNVWKCYSDAFLDAAIDEAIKKQRNNNGMG